MAVCLLEGGQVNVWNQPPGVMSGASTCCEEIYEQHERFSPQSDDVRLYTAILTKLALKSVDVLPWPTKSLDLSPFELEWNSMEENCRVIHNQY
ncbi:hypothetical protein TNCV_2356911 [Trichonephila clavipes]|nr:hypothetical protein TNCV_2356911 [Trichonephila clavipes]